jgi:hypothetical protein
MSARSLGKLAWAALLLASAALIGLPAVASAQPSALSGDGFRAQRARDATVELDVAGARAILDGADPADPILAVERARLALYEGDCDGAAAILSRSDLAATAFGAELGDIARGCVRATAATVIVRDQERGVVVRLQDDEDRAMVPLMAEVADRARALLTADLGVTLPKPIFIDLVRDQFTLSAMTGLPLQAAQTTGTVAVAKWGRVTMISPRATPSGYPWLDTLVHELTHLALTQATRDKAPLWLQEGVAKREESRWRDREPFDDLPSPDAIAVIGLERGLGRPIDKLGPSIAMLPSPEQAQVAFAEVASFIRFYARDAGDAALPRLLQQIKTMDRPDDIDEALRAVSGSSFGDWDKRWRAYLATVPRNIPPDLAPGAPPLNLSEVSKRVRLGELLLDRGHARAAVVQHTRAQSLVPHEPVLRCMLAAAMLASADRPSALPLVEKTTDVHSRHGRWWSLHGLLHPDPTRSPSPFRLGIALDPLNPAISCEEKPSPDLPEDALHAALCAAARRVPR